MRLHDYDIAVLVKLLWGSVEPNWTYRSLGAELGLSPSSVLKAVERTSFAGLYRADKRRPLRPALMEFLVHGLKYAFPVHPGPVVRGVFTAFAHPRLRQEILLNNLNEAYVWESPKGDRKGQSIVPLLPDITTAIENDASFYEAMALVECLRIGRKRETELAVKLLKEMETQCVNN